MKIKYDPYTRTFSLKDFYRKHKTALWTLGGLAAGMGLGIAADKFNNFRHQSDLKELTDKERKEAEELYNERQNNKVNENELDISTDKLTDSEKDKNVKSHIDTLKSEKSKLMKDLDLSNEDYDKLAKLSLGQINSESEFGTSNRYKYKKYVPDIAIDFGKWITGRESSDRSQGYGQVKYNYLEPYSKLLYEKYGIDEDTIDSSDKSALSTIIKLAEIYNKDVKGKDYKDRVGNKVSDEDAIMYYYTGRGKGLRNSEILPADNTYIQNSHRYMDKFN